MARRIRGDLRICAIWSMWMCLCLTRRRPAGAANHRENWALVNAPPPPGAQAVSGGLGEVRKYRKTLLSRQPSPQLYSGGRGDHSFEAIQSLRASVLLGHASQHDGAAKPASTSKAISSSSGQALVVLRYNRVCPPLVSVTVNV